MIRVSSSPSSTGPAGNSSTVTSPTSTRDAILAAALVEFTAFGYRRAAIEGIARRADLARATVYLHYRGKEEIFRDAVTRLHAEHLTAMQSAAADPSADILTRLVALLRARFGRFVELVASSPSATELYDMHNTLCGDVATAADKRADKILATALQHAMAAGEIDLTASGLTVKQLATALTDCARGAKGGEGPGASTPTEFAARLTYGVRAILAGVRSRSAQ